MHKNMLWKQYFHQRESHTTLFLSSKKFQKVENGEDWTWLLHRTIKFRKTGVVRVKSSLRVRDFRTNTHPSKTKSPIRH